MNPLQLLAAAAVFAMSATASAAGPSAAVLAARAGTGAKPAHAPETVLYNQNDQALGWSILSSDFDAPYDTYDSQGADDFTVPEGECWKITGVDVTGTYFNGAGPAHSFRVIVYKNHGSRPSESRIVSDQTGVVPTVDDLAFSLALPNAIKAKPGKYWISVLANMSLDEQGEWAWMTRDLQAGKPAVWKNQGGELRPDCTSYGNMLSCVGQIGQGPDFMFALKGKSKSC